LHAWLKYKLNQLIYDIRAGKYPGFVLSSQTFDGNDQENWEQLCKELEKIGISENVIRERREFIIAWFEGAIEDRRLDEDKPDLVGEGKLDPAGEDIGGMEEKSWKGPKSTQPATRLYERTSSQTQATPAPRERNSRSWLSYRLFALKSDLHYALKPDELLINAAREGDATKVEELLKRGANVNYHTTKKCSKGQTPLHQALVGVHEAVARLLMEKGADVKAADDQEQTVFHLAALHSNRAMVGLLVDKGIHIEARNERGRTALHLAVALGSKDVVQLLVDQGAEIEARDNLGGTVLHRAAEWGREAIILLLVDKGANIDARDKDGRTPLCTAAMNAKLNAVQLLLDKGADIEARDDHGLTALHSAASHVAEKEADIEESHNDGPMSGYTAAKRARTAIVQLLVDKGADVEAKTDSGEKALNIAASRGHYAIVRILDSK
jgi:ankyrin repeat protein